MTNVAIIGAGSFGMALSHLLGGKGVPVALWCRRPEVAEAIRRTGSNPGYLPDVRLPARVRSTGDLEDALRDAAVVVWVTPTAALRATLASAGRWVAPTALLVAACKGIEQETFLSPARIIAEVSGAPPERLAALSGPSFAREVVAGVPTAVTIASASEETAVQLQSLFSTPSFRAYTSTDLVGVEVGGALKNVIAIAAGICDGLRFGHNARAALITRGLAEITRMAVRLGGRPLTLAGLSGLGDLVLTCCGDLSRNRTVGMKLGQGQDLAPILAEMKMVAEGVHTARSAHAMSLKLGVEMPITTKVYEVLYEGLPPRRAVEELMTRELKAESR
ncbi:MAG: NAD(P)-dependent glycerol-3-phosphate dehydrogenase [Nitrospirae bacterium]|nr:NAD(P)-dependent glycerol-3-phosphate dehydrogenase [Nitrospirota bacterium]